MGILTTVAWSAYVIGAPDANTGSHRVTMPGGGPNSSVSMVKDGADYPTGQFWTSNTGLGSSVSVNGETFNLPFWHLTWTNVDTDETFGELSRGDWAVINVGSESPDARFTGRATVYYVWDPGPDSPPGPRNCLYIDAYDASLNEFIPDIPWVEVATTPSWQPTQDPNTTTFTEARYPDDPLSAAINDQGFVETDVTIATGAGIKVSARDIVDASAKTIKTFSGWWLVRMSGVVVVVNGAITQFYPGDRRDAYLGHDCIVALIAIYNGQRFVTEVPGNPHLVGEEIYQIEMVRREQVELSQRIGTLTQQMADQEERATTLARRFDAVTASVMALAAHVEALAKPPRTAEPIARPEQRPIAGEQVTAAPAVARPGFFARLFRRGR